MLSIEAKSFFKNISVSDDYSTNFNTLSTVSSKLGDLDVSDKVYEILLCCSNINSLVGSIVYSDFELIMRNGVSKLSDNKTFCNLINAYCVINNSYADIISSDDYYRFIDNIDVLSESDERFLFKLLNGGDIQIKKKVRDIIIICNLRLVRSIAHKYSLKNTKFKLDELMEEGNIALINAVDNFDVSTGNKFSTYAHNAIKMKIAVFCNHCTSHISFSYDFGEKMIVYMRIKNAYIKKNGVSPSYEYMKEKFRLTWRYEISDRSLDELFNLIEKCSLDAYSLSMPIVSNGGYYLEDIVPDDHEPFYEKLENNDLNGLFEKVFDELDLSDRNREIIYYLYGMNGYPKLGVKKIGKIVGVSYQRIQQISIKVLKRIDDSEGCRYILSGYHK